MTYLLAAVVATLAFPLIAMMVRENTHRMRNRRASRRRTEKIRL
jgi:hypothetical protein